jgi:hypothetical protein
MKIKSTFIRYGTLLCIGSFFVFSSGGPSFNATNAPGDGQFCGDCHAGGGEDASVLLSGVPPKYAQGATYPLQLIVQDPNASIGGFQIVATNGVTNTQVGTFSAPSGTRIVPGSNRLTHSIPKSLSAGSVAWTFNWTAPTVGMPGQIQFYFGGNGANGAMGASGDDGVWGASGLIPLPVQLTKFEGKYNGNGANILSWQTASEHDAQTFIVERSSDNTNFEPIGEVAAQGSSDQIANYIFSDDQLGVIDGFYYRLAQRDFDGTIHRYQVIRVEILKPQIRIQYLDGTPACIFGNQLRISIESNISVGKARLMSIDGRTHTMIQVPENSQELHLPHQGQGGLHILQLFDLAGNLVYSEKVL